MMRKKLTGILLLCLLLGFLNSCGDIPAGEAQNVSGNETAGEVQDTAGSETAGEPQDTAGSETADKLQSTTSKMRTRIVLPETADEAASISLSDIPEYDGSLYVELLDNVPLFTQEDLTTDVWEEYSELDALGRCGAAYANICTELMPTEKREGIGQIRPSGWHTVKYPEVIEDNYLYNRCHLIAYQLAGENANEQNLITGTRYFNVEGMLPFEEAVADYVRETDYHVLYRVTPLFEGDNLVADGVEMEAWSVEDDGQGICFHVFVYNVQPGVGIDYATGDSWLEETSDTAASQSAETSGSAASQSGGTSGTDDADDQVQSYILNTNTKKFHYPGCSSVQEMYEQNKEEYTGTRSGLIEQGYSPCGRCRP